MRCRRSVAALLLLALLAGCGGTGDDGTGDMAAAETAPAPEAPATTAPAPKAPETASSLKAPPCPPAAANCERASGRIVYVERVDPDGDGDAHFVLLSDEGITAPGISVIDVRADLRPQPLPGPGDELAASGPVYRGSYGQRQIQADRIAVGTEGP